MADQHHYSMNKPGVITAWVLLFVLCQPLYSLSSAINVDKDTLSIVDSCDGDDGHPPTIQCLDGIKPPTLLFPRQATVWTCLDLPRYRAPRGPPPIS